MNLVPYAVIQLLARLGVRKAQTIARIVEDVAEEITADLATQVERRIRHGIASGEFEVHPDDVDKPFDQWRVRLVAK